MKLNTNTLTTYSGAAQLPAYSRAAVTPGIAHIGVGAFHRAHQAVYVDDCLAHAPDWGIRGISLRRPDTRDALAPQHGLYTLGVRDGSGLSARVIGALMSVDMGAQNAVRLIADKETRLVTITVTEKAYADTAPGSLAAILVQGLAERRQAGHGPITVLSCDNLLDNGARTAAIVQQGALAHGDLATWIDHNVSFPSVAIER